MENVINTKKNELNKELSDREKFKQKLLTFEHIVVVDKYTDEHFELNLVKAELAHARAEIEYYRELLKLSRSQQFAPKTEQTPFEDVQLRFDDLGEVEEVIEEVAKEELVEPEVETFVRKRKAGNVGSKKECFDDLETVEIIHDIPENKRKCTECGTELVEIGRSVREEIEVVPVKFIKKRHITIAYGCPECKDNSDKAFIEKAKGPAAILPGSYASESLLSWVICKKYWEKTPLYRLEKMLDTLDLHIPRATMSNWIIKSADMYLAPVFQKMHEELLRANVVNVDETPMLVIKDGRETKSKSYMWFYSTGSKEEKQICLYEYSPTRNGDNAVRFLDGYHGYLQSDAFPGYNKLKQVTRIGCMAHARRKFVDAMKALDKKEAAKKTLSSEGVRLFDKIFYFENSIKDLPIEGRYRERLKNKSELVDPLMAWVSKNITLVAKKSKLGEALDYAQKNMTYLTNYLLDGAVDVSNNKAERGIKEFVIGRKNSLFSYSKDGAQGSAICYSIVETAKANKLNPYEYIKYILKELSDNKMTDEKLSEIMPWSEKLPEEVRLKMPEVIEKKLDEKVNKSSL